MRDRDWLLDRLLAMQIELTDAENTAEDLRAALAHQSEDCERRVVRIEARLAKGQARCGGLMQQVDSQSVELVRVAQRLEVAAAALLRAGVDWEGG